MPYILALSTHDSRCSVAISRGYEILFSFTESVLHTQAENLVLIIEKALESAKVSYSNLDYVAVVNGPGSFTGIRIGLATAAGINIGTGATAFALTNFELIYHTVIEEVSSYNKVLVLLNAYRDQIYWQEFDRKGCAAPPGIVYVQDIMRLLSSCSSGTVVAGDGIKLLSRAAISMDHLIIMPRFAKIKAHDLCRFAYTRIESKIELGQLQPLYIRFPDAIASKVL